jgi:lysophospholipase L1-like esterase/predicted esterase
MAAHTFESATHGALPYRLFTPADRGDGVRLPLVLFLHGAGERGTDNRRQLAHGVAEFVSGRHQAARPCFVAAPQCPRGRWWDLAQLVLFAEAMAALPGVDADRVYVTGLSMGGFATWHLIAERPGLFAAAVPVCGGGRPETAARLASLPIWAFHGGADGTVPKEQSRAMVDAIRKAGGEPKYTEYAGVGHDSWTRTYADAGVHEWLFAQRRAPQPVPLREGERMVFLGDSITEAGADDGGWIRLLEADLRARPPAAGIELIGAGVSGNRVPDLLVRLQRDVLDRKPTLVVVYIGINDVWHSEQGSGTPKPDYEAGLRDLVRRIGAAGARAILCTPSVIGERPDGSNKLDPMLDDYAAVTRAVAADARLQLLDLRRLFLAHLRAGNGGMEASGVLTSDGVHLNDAGHRFLADRMLEALGVGPVPGGK